jgi:hypothetical protein
MNCQLPKIKSALKNFPAKFRITVFDCKAQAARQDKTKEKRNSIRVLISCR